MIPAGRVRCAGIGALLVCILFGALWVRRQTFWIPHWQGDQSQYVALAMKLDQKGMAGYHLYNVAIRVITIKGTDKWQVIYPTLTPNSDVGDIIRAYEMHGLTYYDMPLFYKAPLFPMALMYAHRLLTAGDHPYLIVKTNLREEALRLRPAWFLQAQLWAVVVPLVSNLLVILWTYLLGRRLFGDREGLYGAAIMAANPISVVSSNRLLTEDFTGIFCIVTVWLFVGALGRRSWLGACAAGLVAGLAVLAKQSSILVPLVLCVYAAAVHLRTADRGRPGPFFAAVFNPYALCLVGGMLFVSAHWFIKVWQVYGTPLYEPTAQEIVRGDETGWHDVLAMRPHAAILYTVGLSYLCPPMLIGYLSVFRRWFDKGVRSSRDLWPHALLWLWFGAYFLFFATRGESKEQRYLLPAHPALALLAASTLSWLRLRLAGRAGTVIAEGAIVSILAVSALWSVPMALETIFDEKFLILKPF
ncbi:MAG: hypothetical protein MOGMAGMI_00011 [Candidatus Omnitrophica bacterium]|nr:hypothetical protein [Candidatus Omnitrophota bacterium]